MAGIEPDVPTDDLRPLYDLVGDARLVGFGTSALASGGLYAAQHRLIRAWIEERGVRVLAMQTPRTQARGMDAYITSGPCDQRPELVMRAIFGVYGDDNTYAFMRWLCERNATMPNDQVRFFGFDTQQPEEDLAEIRRFLRAHAPSEAQALVAALASCTLEWNTEPNAQMHAACIGGIDAFDSWLAERAAALTAAAGERAVRLLKLASVGFRAYQVQVHYSTLDDRRSVGAWSGGMATVFDEILDLDFGSDAKVALWAHTWHLRMAYREIDNGRFPNVGTLLAERYSDDYASVAITAYAPGTHWRHEEYKEHTTLGTQAGSVEKQLHLEGGAPYLILDPNAPWLPPERKRRITEELVEIRKQYTAVVYLDHSPPMNAVFW